MILSEAIRSEAWHYGDIVTGVLGTNSFRRFIRSAGLAMVGVLVVASVTRTGQTVRLAGGLAALYVAGEYGATLRMAWRALLVAPPAFLVMLNAGPRLQQRWAAPLLTALVVLCAVGIDAVRKLAPVPGGFWMLALMTAAGVYACVPETGHLRALASSIVVLAAIEMITQERLGPGVVTVALGLLAWSVAYGGTFRDSAVIGGVATFGLLALAPVAVLRPRYGRRRLSSGIRRTVATVLQQAVAALVVSRTGGLADSAVHALTQVVPTVALLVVASHRVLGPGTRSENARGSTPARAPTQLP